MNVSEEELADFEGVPAGALEVEPGSESASGGSHEDPETSLIFDPGSQEERFEPGSVESENDTWVEADEALSPEEALGVQDSVEPETAPSDTIEDSGPLGEEDKHEGSGSREG
jgi:hypothetical protein